MPVWRQYRSLRKESPLHIAVLLYFMGENTILRTALPYITYGVCRDLRHNTTADMCLHIDEYPDQALDIQDDSVLLSMAERMSSTFPAVFLTALCGSWSGRYGHKAPFLLPFLGNLLSALCFLLAFYVHDLPVLAFLGAGFLTKALSGQKLLLRLLSYTYMLAMLHNAGSYEETGAGRERQLECQTLLENRQRGVPTRKNSEGSEEEVGRRGRLLVGGICRLHVAESLGSVAGSLLSWLCQICGGGAVWAFLVGAGVSLIGVGVVACGIQNYRLYHNNDYPTCSTSYTRKTPKLDVNPVQFVGYLSILFFAASYSAGRTALIVPYVQQAPLSWPRSRYSAYAACFTAFHTLFLLAVAPRIRSHTVAVVGLLFATAGGMWTAFSTTTWSMLIAGCLSRMVECVSPVFRASIGADVQPNQMGRVLFDMSLVEAFATVLGPLAFAQLYVHTKDYYPGLAFLLTAAVLAAVVVVGAVVWVLCGWGFKSSTQRKKEEEPPAPEMAARDASQRPDYTQSVDMLRPVLVYHDCMWRSAEW